MTTTLFLLALTFLRVIAPDAGDVASLIAQSRQAFKVGDYATAEREGRLAVSASEHSGDMRAEALADLGGVLLARAKYAESEQLSQDALRLLRDAPRQRYYAVVLNNLGQLSLLKRNYAEAETFLKDSLKAAETFDSKDPYIARIHNSLGSLYFNKGDRGKASKAFKRGIEIIESTQPAGRTGIELALILNNLGYLYIVEKKLNDAGALFSKALSALERDGAASHPIAASVLHSQGALNLALEHFDKAHEAYRKAYAIRVRVLGAKHPSVALTALNLAVSLAADSRYQEAESRFNEALETYREATGAQSLEVLITMEELARFYRKTSRVPEAEAMEARAQVLRSDREHTVPVQQLAR